MSSGFVSGGTIDKPAERDDAWRQAQQELAESRARKEEAAQNDGKSLYEVLQANKAAKQEAFEEATRLKNQYRALDDDEAEFLESVLEETRKKEQQVKKETAEQLEAFRRQREEAERKALEEANARATIAPVEEAPLWVAPGRKRKKSEKEGPLLRRVKLRRGSSGAGAASPDAAKVGKAETSSSSAQISSKDRMDTTQLKNADAEEKSRPTESVKATAAASPKGQPPKKVALSLGYASSDEDD